MTVETMMNNKKTKLIFYAVVAVALLALPQITGNGYLLRIINMILIYCIISVSINLIGGYGGELAMGHACYVGVGAYTTAILATKFSLPFWATLPVSLIAATVFGFLTAILCVGRIKGDYVMIVTMGVSEITRIFFVNAANITNGPMGIPQVPGISLLGFQFHTGKSYYYLFLICLVVTILVIRNIVNSKFGRDVVAIREDKVAAKAMGIKVNLNKIINFTITAFFAGLAGVLLAHYNQFVGPMQFSLDEGLLYFQMIIIGGLGSIPGSILGAGILVLIPEVFRGIAVYRTIVYGLIMVVMMIVRPQGLLGDDDSNHVLIRWSGQLRNGLKRLFMRKGAEDESAGC
ncbi:branched-chain amino acid ABC transporter permease [Clostridia bacterium]|nr:branched-chain amino acid ABC transporter permease [Clostridia bacterium]